MFLLTIQLYKTYLAT